MEVNHKEVSELSDQELLEEAKKKKSGVILNAVLIGFLVGIVIYSFLVNTLGFITLFPLVLAYKLFNNPKYKSNELEAELSKRGLKN